MLVATVRLYYYYYLKTNLVPKLQPEAVARLQMVVSGLLRLKIKT